MGVSHMRNFIPGVRTSFMYTNWKNRRRLVRCIVESFGFQRTGYHQNQWVLNGYDLDKQARRSYALKDIETESIGMVI